MATLSEFLQVSEFLLDTKTGEQTALALAHQVLVRAEVGNADNKVRLFATPGNCVPCVVVFHDYPCPDASRTPAFSTR